MRNNYKKINSILILSVGILLGACVTTYKPTKTSLELQAFQSTRIHRLQGGKVIFVDFLWLYDFFEFPISSLHQYISNANGFLHYIIIFEQTSPVKTFFYSIFTR